MTEIRNAIRRLAGKGSEPVILRNGIVKSVDWDKRTCIVYLDKDDAPDLLLYDVRLRAVADDKPDGVCIRPEDDSMVLVGIINNNENNCYVAAYSEVKSVEVKMKDITLTVEEGTVKLKCKKFEWEADETIINGGNNKGLVKIEKLVDKINQLEDKMKNHQHVAPPGGGATATNGTQLIGLNTTVGDLEDEKIKH